MIWGYHFFRKHPESAWVNKLNNMFISIKGTCETSWPAGFPMFWHLHATPLREESAHQDDNTMKFTISRDFVGGTGYCNSFRSLWEMSFPFNVPGGFKFQICFFFVLLLLGRWSKLTNSFQVGLKTPPNISLAKNTRMTQKNYTPTEHPITNMSSEK